MQKNVVPAFLCLIYTDLLKINYYLGIVYVYFHKAIALQGTTRLTILNICTAGE